MEKSVVEKKTADGMNLWWELIPAMMRTGLFAYGGGPSVIPLIRHEAVRRYQWMDDDEFGEIVALANALPGPIATKLAAYLGYRLKGTVGAVVAVIVHILPTSVAMVALLGFLYALRHSKVVTGMIAAVRPVIVAMLGLMAYEFAEKAGKGLGKGPALLFGVLAFLLLAAGMHPAVVVLLALAYGSVHLRAIARIQAIRVRWDDRHRGNERSTNAGSGDRDGGT